MQGSLFLLTSADKGGIIKVNKCFAVISELKRGLS